MFVDLETVDFSGYDVFVAGSGFAGYSIAKKMSEAGKTALIIETGIDQYDADIQDAHSAMSGRGHYDGSHWPFHWIRALGGTSAAWGGWCGPLLPRNFKEWPIEAADLEKYYESAAVELGLSETISSYSTSLIEGFDYRPFSTDLPLRLGDTTEYFDALSGVDVLLNCTIAGLEANDERSAVTAFSIYQPEKENQQVRMAENQVIVLAAGAMGNAQILLGSRMPSGPEVGNETDQVGRYLMEHPHFLNCGRMIVRSEFEPPAPPSSFGDHSTTIVPDAAVFEEIGGIDVALTLNRTSPDLEDPVEKYLIEKLGPDAQVYSLTIMAEMEAEAENRVVRGVGNDPSGLPTLHAQCTIATSTFRAADASLVQLSDQLTKDDWGRVRIFNDTLYFDATGGGHIMGTTRMGDDPATSVVDKDCRVHNYRNLFVAGSSVFTTGGYANPTLTIVALTQRLGDTLINEVLS